MKGPFWINEQNDVRRFPPVQLALDDPNGLLAVGGDLSPERLIAAYRQGIFPWYNDDQPILWWSPSPRAVLFPDQLYVSRSLKKTLKKKPFDIRLDQHFAAVINACAEPRRYESGTWIIAEMQQAYLHLHQLGHAHCVEAWQGGKLVGGLYGIAIGQVFFGESMFSRVTNASKVAFVYLTRQLQSWGYQLIDCQVASPHLQSLGATEISRGAFLKQLAQGLDLPGKTNPWYFDPDFNPIATND